jgi:hypothetical protein
MSDRSERVNELGLSQRGDSSSENKDHDDTPLPSVLPPPPVSETETVTLQGLMREMRDRDRARGEEMRGLMESIIQMSRTSVLPPTMGLTTPVSMHSRLRMPLDQRTPFGSSRLGVGEGVGVRRPLFVAPPVVRAPPPPPAPVVAPAASPPAAVRDPPPPKVNSPKPFKGTLSERDGAEKWLSSVMNWLSIAGKNQPEDMRVLMFGTVLESDALTWFNTLQQMAREDQVELSIQLLSDEFLIKYAGGATHIVRQMEFSSLVYGKGKCVDVVSTQTEFERLASSLYPGASLNPLADELLAMAFAEVYRKGDFKLWEKAVEMNPITLDEWKAAVQRAFMIRQTVAEGRKAILRNASQATGAANRPFHSSSSSDNSIARVHHVDASSGIGLTDSDEEEDEVKEPAPSENLQQMGTAKKGGGGRKAGPKDKKRAPGFVTTYAERQILMRKGQCFHCYKAGHRVSECPDIDKPARRPTAEELNL